jgi:hypothetical protein
MIQIKENQETYEIERTRTVYIDELGRGCAFSVEQRTCVTEYWTGHAWSSDESRARQFATQSEALAHRRDKGI